MGFYLFFFFFELQVKQLDLCAIQNQTLKYPDPCVWQTSANVAGQFCYYGECNNTIFIPSAAS